MGVLHFDVRIRREEGQHKMNTSGVAWNTGCGMSLYSPLSILTNTSATATTSTTTTTMNHLMPLAPTMALLLSQLKDLPFTEQSQIETRSTTDRGEALSTLMQILQEQAEKDGFRVITINAEPKRVIMACNRQGKPPQSPVKEESTAADVMIFPDDNARRSNRLGTSIRCGCRMRINVNYHSKLNAWRVTSFEAEHNHPVGALTIPSDEESSPDTVVPVVEESPSVEPYSVSPHMIKSAMAKYSMMNQTPEQHAIAALTALASPSAAPSNISMSSYAARPSINTSWLQSRGSISSESSISSLAVDTGSLHHHGPRSAAALERIPESPSMLQHMGSMQQQSSSGDNAAATFLKGRRPSRILIVRRRSPGSMSAGPLSAGIPTHAGNSGSDGSMMPFSPVQQTTGPFSAFPNGTTMHFSSPTMVPLSLSGSGATVIGGGAVDGGKTPSPLRDDQSTTLRSLKGITSTAVEIDRYAMLHQSFKRLIAVACKRRDWSQDVLNGVGRFMEQFQQQPASANSFGPASAHLSAANQNHPFMSPAPLASSSATTIANTNDDPNGPYSPGAKSDSSHASHTSSTSNPSSGHGSQSATRPNSSFSFTMPASRKGSIISLGPGMMSSLPPKITLPMPDGMANQNVPTILELRQVDSLRPTEPLKRTSTIMEEEENSRQSANATLPHPDKRQRVDTDAHVCH